MLLVLLTLLLLVGSSQLLGQVQGSPSSAWRLSGELTRPGVAPSHTYSYWLTRTTKCPVTHNPISLVRVPQLAFLATTVMGGKKNKPHYFPFVHGRFSKLMNISFLLKFPTVVALFFLWLCGLGIITIVANIRCVLNCVRLLGLP